jgi:hypothetical protein
MAEKKPRKKKVVETPPVAETPVEAPVEAPKVEVATEESTAKKEFRLYMGRYKVQNPVKYAQKEAEFLKHLNTL